MTAAQRRADDLSIYVLPGRAPDPTVGVQEADDAEKAGFGGIYVSERLDVKEAAVVCGALVARTDHVRVGTALVHQGTRHPLTLASMAATLQLMSRGRFVLGIGRGLGALAPSLGVAKPTLASIEHVVTTVRRLWAGERITENGPAGSFRGLRFADIPTGPPPPILFGTVGSRGLELAGRLFDGVILHPFLTTDAVARSGERVRRAAEAGGRDPGALRVVSTVVTAPALSAEREDLAVRARAISYLQVRGLGEVLVAANGWDPTVLQAIREHPTLTGKGIADTSLSRDRLVDAAEVIPPDWFSEGAAFGTIAHCVARIRSYRNAGADEILLHGASPSEAAAMVPAWTAAEADHP
ncbi:MAG: 5,10-methylenetetrahydromethanopterin reductase [Actinomycetota bacterium]|nr:5,10-methylenetetrahydromethanopterin reductase [Actinomycetota bacterium]